MNKKTKIKKLVKFGSKEFNAAMKKEMAVAATAYDPIDVEIGNIRVKLYPKKATYDDGNEIDALRGHEEDPTDPESPNKFKGMSFITACIIVLMRDENGEKVFSHEHEDLLEHINSNGWNDVVHRVRYLMGLDDDILLKKHE